MAIFSLSSFRSGYILASFLIRVIQSTVTLGHLGQFTLHQENGNDFPGAVHPDLFSTGEEIVQIEKYSKVRLQYFCTISCVFLIRLA